MAVTVAREITDPVLSDTVPEKLPFAWPYTAGQVNNRNADTALGNALLGSINDPRVDDFRVQRRMGHAVSIPSIAMDRPSKSHRAYVKHTQAPHHPPTPPHPV